MTSYRCVFCNEEYEDRGKFVAEIQWSPSNISDEIDVDGFATRMENDYICRKDDCMEKAFELTEKSFATDD